MSGLGVIKVSGKQEADRLPKWRKDRVLLQVIAAIYQNGEEKPAMRCLLPVCTPMILKRKE